VCGKKRMSLSAEEEWGDITSDSRRTVLTYDCGRKCLAGILSTN